MDLDNVPEDSHWRRVNAGASVISNSPVSLWQNAITYFEWCDTNPIIVKRVLTAGKEAGKRISFERTRPYSVKALCLHCNILERYFYDLYNSKDKANEYYIVAAKIVAIIYTQQLEYAQIGEFNPIFTAKLLQLDKGDDEDKSRKGTLITIVTGLPELNSSEQEVLRQMEMEKRYLENEEGLLGEGEKS